VIKKKKKFLERKIASETEGKRGPASPLFPRGREKKGEPHTVISCRGGRKRPIFKGKGGRGNAALPPYVNVAGRKKEEGKVDTGVFREKKREGIGGERKGKEKKDCCLIVNRGGKGGGGVEKGIGTSLSY